MRSLATVLGISIKTERQDSVDRHTLSFVAFHARAARLLR